MTKYSLSEYSLPNYRAFKFQVIYLFEDPYYEYPIKIGITEKLLDREGSIRRHDKGRHTHICPLPLGIKDENKKFEAAFHNCLEKMTDRQAPKGVKGNEWFRLNKEVLKFINRNYYPLVQFTKMEKNGKEIWMRKERYNESHSIITQTSVIASNIYQMIYKLYWNECINQQYKTLAQLIALYPEARLYSEIEFGWMRFIPWIDSINSQKEKGFNLNLKLNINIKRYNDCVDKLREHVIEMTKLMSDLKNHPIAVFINFYPIFNQIKENLKNLKEQDPFLRNSRTISYSGFINYLKNGCKKRLQMITPLRRIVNHKKDEWM